MNPITIVIPTLYPDIGAATGLIAQITARCEAYVVVSHDANEQGFSKTVNDGMRIAPKHHDICILNDDILTFYHGWLWTLQRALYTSSKYGIAGPSGNSSTAPLCYGRLGESGVQSVEQVPFWCALIKRTLIDKIGLLDESFIHYASDNWYCKTALNHKFKIIWVRDVWLHHKQHGSGLKNKWKIQDQETLARKTRNAKRPKRRRR